MKSEPSPQFDWADLDKVVTVRKPPPNAFTIADFAIRYGVGRTQARNMLQKLVEKGVLDKMEKAGSLPAQFWYKKGKK